ncbi:cytochrome P450 [Actinocrispum wychmicini]|uniref:Cytochrome P450 n=1 Tax=Actinocrispum wychmicini TaxID=1213861 RepID=A0A4R2K3G9_9PSEU|nr:cytochrome P450 [Actinocrispum wychmicini]TCO60865.1 cytochrome P450 [Actinocrispum wychmicini]
MATVDVNQVSAADTLPPGPTSSRIVQTFKYTVARSKFYADLQRKYGDTFTMRITGNRNIVALTRPEHIKTVFTGPSSVFHASEANKILLPVTGPNSLLALDEDPHLRARKLLMPAFNGAALRGYRDMMTDLTLAEIERWPTGQVFASQPRMAAITLEVILRVVFGMDKGPRLTELRDVIHRISSIGPIGFIGWAYPKLDRFWPWKRNKENLQLADRLLYAEIDERRAATDLADRQDVLSRLLTGAEIEATNPELRDHMISLLIAGHDTTSTALAWTFHELARRPEVQRAAHDAADRGDEDYLLAIHKEVMRLRPVVQNVGRTLMQPTEVAGYQLPAGTIVAPIINVVHRAPEAHEAPEEFRPERFVGKQPDANTWIPFGGGVHRCVGAGFSLQESGAVLLEVLRRYHVSVPSLTPEQPRSRHVTQVPGNGSRIIVTPRQSA